MGSTALHGSCDWPVALPLYAGCWCWTMLYDTIYAHQDKADDARAGVHPHPHPHPHPPPHPHPNPNPNPNPSPGRRALHRPPPRRAQPRVARTLRGRLRRQPRCGRRRGMLDCRAARRARGRLPEAACPRPAAAPPQGRRAWRLWAARGSQGECRPTGEPLAGSGASQPPPKAAHPKAAHPTASGHAGLSSTGAAPGVHVPALGAGLACGAAHLAWQLRTVDFHSRADCLRKFQPSSTEPRAVLAVPRLAIPADASGIRCSGCLP